MASTIGDFMGGVAQTAGQGINQALGFADLQSRSKFRDSQVELEKVRNKLYEDRVALEGKQQENQVWGQFMGSLAIKDPKMRKLALDTMQKKMSSLGIHVPDSTIKAVQALDDEKRIQALQFGEGVIKNNPMWEAFKPVMIDAFQKGDTNELFGLFAKMEEMRMSSNQTQDPYSGLPGDIRAEIAAQNDPIVSKALDTASQRAIDMKSAGKGEGELPSTLIKPVGEAKASLSAIDKVISYFTPEKNAVGNKYVGMIQGRVGNQKSKFGNISSDEAEFRTRANLMKVELRKFYFGTAQSKQELEGSLGAIPDVNMSNAQFSAALKVHRDRVQTWINEIEAGTRKPGTIKEKDQNDFSDMSDEEFSKTQLGQ